jgi:hypothetical protein
VDEALAAIISRQFGVFRRAQALRFYARAEVDRRLRSGEWVILRHGVYTTAAYVAAHASPRDAHLLKAAARRLVIGGDTLLSHESAAFFHGIELLDRVPDEPVLTRHRRTGVSRDTAHDLYVAAVPPPHRLGRVTAAPRTVADCARDLSREAAFVTIESALALGLERWSILEVLRWCRRWPGAARASDLVMMAQPWSESALESLSMLWCRDQHLPLPRQQLTIRTVGGRFVARSDLVWEAYAVVGELDGRKKYEAAEEPASKVAWREKLREDDIRDQGLQVVRGYWSDVADGGAAFAERWRRAAARSASYVGTPSYVFLDERRRTCRGPLAA